MLVDSSTTAVGSTVTGAIRQASAVTGTSFNYLLATAQVESGLNPHAGASTSSARGLFQFIDQTWLGTMKQSGAELGYGRYAAAISRTASGHYQVTDPEMRSEILKLRNDPTANAVMAGAFTRANADTLSKKLGRAPSEGELYIAHFLGAGGAAKLISAANSNPDAKATQYFPVAASANSSIFFDRSTGAPRTVAQVRNILTARYDVARGRSDPIQTAQVTTAPSTAGEPLDVTAMLTSRVPRFDSCRDCEDNRAGYSWHHLGLCRSRAGRCGGPGFGEQSSARRRRESDVPWLVSGYRSVRARCRYREPALDNAERSDRRQERVERGLSRSRFTEPVLGYRARLVRHVPCLRVRS